MKIVKRSPGTNGKRAQSWALDVVRLVQKTSPDQSVEITNAELKKLFPGTYKHWPPRLALRVYLDRAKKKLAYQPRIYTKVTECGNVEVWREGGESL